MRAAPVVLVLAAALFAAAPARAQGACEAAVASWVERCSVSRGIAIEVVRCPPDRVVLRVPSGPLDVELSRSADRSFARAAGIGLSPVGEFADWASEPPSRRRALEDLRACVEADPSVREAFGSGRDKSRVRIPWLLLGALAATIVMIASLGRRARPPVGRDVAVAAGLALSAFALRALLLPWAFLHQNGQGASWIELALHDSGGLAAYGPGYAELHSWVVRIGGAHPERAVFLWSALLGATVPALAYVVARRLGAHRMAALAVAAVPLLDPISGRAFQSESYFGVITALLMAAAAVLAFVPFRRSPLGSGAAVVAGALLLAQAVRIHPTAWPAAAVIPCLSLLGLGSWRRRAKTTLAVGLGVGVVVGLASGGVIADVIHGSLGHQWLPRAMPRWSVLHDRMVEVAMLAALAAGLSLRSWRGVAMATLGIGVIAIARLSDLLGGPNPVITAVQHRLELPAAICIAAAWMARAARRPRRLRMWAPAVAGAALLSAMARFPAATRLPTDALEARWAMEWRERLEPNANVASVERAGQRLARLPLYSGFGPTRFAISADSVPPSFDEMPEPAYYYRSSLCSTEDGRRACEQLEQTTRLRLVEERDLPARPSMRWLGYHSDRVRVALYRVIR